MAGGWGKDPARPATVKRIEISEEAGVKEGGESVEVVPWTAETKNHVVVDLDTGGQHESWAYGHQIDLID